MSNPRDLADEALALLRRLTGDPASGFRPDQLEAILALAGERRRVLLVQRTGWGKSAVYFIATRLLRDRGVGPTLLVSPLLALMRNQIEAAERLGVRALTINSSNRDEWGEIEEQIEADEVDVLLISPERLANQQFRNAVLPVIGRRSGLLVIDEAHCISDWGHDFRPDYRRLVRVLDLIPAGVPVLCCTATANDRVVADVTTQLGADFAPVRGTLARSGLRLHALDKPSQAERLVWLASRDQGTARHWDRLLPDRRRHRPGGGLAPVPGHSRGRVQRRERRRAPARRRTAAAVQRREGRGGHIRVGHGIRQARPRLRDSLPVAGLAGGLLPAGRAGRARSEGIVGNPAAGVPRTPTSRTTSSARPSLRPIEPSGS